VLAVEPLFTSKVCPSLQTHTAVHVCADSSTVLSPRGYQADRERLTQLLFEQFNVAGLFIADAAVLSMYAVGKLSGLMVDVGAGKVGACRLSASVYCTILASQLTLWLCKTYALCLRASRRHMQGVALHLVETMWTPKCKRCFNAGALHALGGHAPVLSRLIQLGFVAVM